MRDEVISRLKILSGLRTDEHQAAQDGRFRVAAGGASIDVRVSIMPTYYGENAVMRLLAEQANESTLSLLGFTDANQDKLMRAIQKTHGMILLTGPTGSGKTTTLSLRRLIPRSVPSSLLKTLLNTQSQELTRSK
jgi:type II secretory ATPase GspE/PulE/Tfp pilus assembly ATPase PilB-like protein